MFQLDGSRFQQTLIHARVSRQICAREMKEGGWLAGVIQ
jgi:hypothetical protein